MNHMPEYLLLQLFLSNLVTHVASVSHSAWSSFVFEVTTLGSALRGHGGTKRYDLRGNQGTNLSFCQSKSRWQVTSLCHRKVFVWIKLAFQDFYLRSCERCSWSLLSIISVIPFKTAKRTLWIEKEPHKNYKHLRFLTKLRRIWEWVRNKMHQGMQVRVNFDGFSRRKIHHQINLPHSKCP